MGVAIVPLVMGVVPLVMGVVPLVMIMIVDKDCGLSLIISAPPIAMSRSYRLHQGSFLHWRVHLVPSCRAQCATQA